ncbi:MAG: hypothetical protein A2X36_13895 [Elusimicrobia bacterium GWA2_69_24]|nr:MAG: hypothetical protein A2X36_13895 [Elusimicrobia bacterium GWA2_69_24]HBL16709.1 hypothetical protein [Elusimicrobiota bacterium]
MEPADFLPRWKDGQSWRVEYTAPEPSAAAAMDPGDVLRKEVWEYRPRRIDDAFGVPSGWILQIRESRPPGATPALERYEVRFSSSFALLKVTRFNHLDEGHEVFNDSEDAGYRADATRIPLLDWPRWESGRKEGGAFVLAVRTGGRDGFREEFLWKAGSPWWSEASRSYGSRAVRARLLQP